MSEGIIDNGQCLVQARELVQCLEEGRNEDAEKVLGNLTQIYETEIFQELGKLTRELHEALAGFQMDERVSELMEHELPDAKERLDYVIQMTDRAAHKTLNAVEECIPVCDELLQATEDIQDKWHKFLAREMNADQFREMARAISAFLECAAERNRLLRQHLNDILIAQDYQDLTGQTIRRVIKMVQDVEDSLVHFIRISSRRGNGSSGRSEQKERTGLQGPQIPGREDSDAMKSQDEVDELLSSLGF